MGRVGASAVLLVVSIVLFVLAALSVSIGNAEPFDLLAAGLATFAAAHLVP